jgi:hypothetical protein
MWAINQDLVQVDSDKNNMGSYKFSGGEFINKNGCIK